MRAVARSGVVIDESGDGATERRGHCPCGRFPTRRVHDDHEVMARWNGERVSRCANRSAQTSDTSVAKIIRTDVSRIVYLIVGDAFDVGRTTECRIDRHAVTTRRAARVSEGERLVIVRSGETASRARLTATVAWATVAADTISLRGITRRESVGRNGLIRTAGARRDGERDRLAAACVSQVK